MQCVTPKDDAKLSTVEWAVPIAVLSVMATSTAVGYYMLKRPVSSGGASNTSVIVTSEDGYLVPANTKLHVSLDNTSAEPISVVYDEVPVYDEVQYMMKYQYMMMGSLVNI
ncbi:hypothetical protein BSPWISOXPB_10318 [uncultured Gammaproteobacteria bacterium]|nr:hypothetical protein BSPWISOXPB_10318 [uncultured Gammaproteobacteria bacterium]